MWGIKKIHKRIDTSFKKSKVMAELIHDNMSRIKALEEVQQEREQQIETITSILEEQTIQIRDLNKRVNKLYNKNLN